MADELFQERVVGRCIEKLHTSCGPIELGYRIQGLAAHLLLAQGLKVVEVNPQGHPDIVAVGHKGVLRFEIEANTMGTGEHQLTEKDFASLKPQVPGDKGFFGVAICGPYPSWLIIDHARLVGRPTPAPLPVLRALSERELSAKWTALFNQLVCRHAEHIQDYSFALLREWALADRGLVF